MGKNFKESVFVKKRSVQFLSLVLAFSMLFTLLGIRVSAEGGSVSVTSINTKGYDWANHRINVQFVFSKQVVATVINYSTDQTANVLPNAISENILLNGNTLKDIIANRGSKEIYIYFFPEGLDIYFPMDLEYTGYNIIMDGSDSIQVLSGFTTPDGSTTTANAKFYYKNNPYNWSTEPVKVTGVSPVGTSGNMDYIYLTFNSSLDANHYNVNYSKNYIYLNNKSFATAEAEGDVVGTWYEGDGRLGYYYKATNPSTFKKDGSDVLVIKKGLLLSDGSAVSKDQTFYYYNGVWTEEAKIVSATDLTVTTFGSQYLFEFFHVSFNKAFTTNVFNAANKNFVKINGYSVSEINATQTAIWRADMWNEGNGTLGIFLLKDTPYSLKHDGTDVIELAAGFRTEDGAVLTTSQFLYLNPFGHFSKAAPLDNLAATEIRSFSNNEYVYIDLGKTVYNNDKYSNYNKDYVKLNGITIRNSGAGLWYESNGKFGIYFEKGTQYSFKNDGTDKIEILPGFMCEDEEIVKSTKTLYYYGGIWHKEKVALGALKCRNTKQVSNFTVQDKLQAVVNQMSLDSGVSVQLKDKNGTVITDLANTAITTSTKLVFLSSKNTVLTSYEAIIFGDVDFDGAVGINDLAAIKSHLLKMTTLSGNSLIAGAINNQSTITISDLIAVKKELLNISKINQNK